MLKTERKIEAELRRLSARLFKTPIPIDRWEYRKCRYLAPGQYEELSSWAPLSLGAHFGEADMTFFLRTRLQIDKSLAGERLLLHMDMGGESAIFINGVPFAGLDRNHTMIELLPHAEGNEILEIEIECYSKNLALNTADAFSEDVYLRRVDLLAVRKNVWDYYFTVKTLYEYIDGCREEYSRLRVIRTIYRSMLCLNYQSDEGLCESIPAARETLHAEVDGLSDMRIPLKLYLAGHSHIDVAWHWPLKETVRKTGRTFSSMLRLMERYPDFHFSQSMPALYEMVQTYYPSLFEQIRGRVQEGRWETLGPMYLEPDCNLISGESFVRQILYGKKYFHEAFGTDSRVCFLPDVFGFSPAMPQILKKSGIDYFFTTKLTWNETNPFPYSIFRWRGMDGSEVTAGMLTMCTKNGRDLYNGDLSPAGLRQSLDCFQNKEDGTPFLYLYGYGDGGGGVTPEMLESAARLSQVPLLPEIHFSGVEEYFESIQTKELPVWSEELYFEKHRGTYTTAAKNKRLNRKSEFLYRDAEMLSCLRRAGGGTFTPVSLEEGWKLILLNQFHDILPGTAIAAVYEQSEAQYEKVKEIGERSISASLAAMTKANEEIITIFNTLSWERNEVVSVNAPDGKAVQAMDGHYPLQVRQGEEIFFLAEKVPPIGYMHYRLVSAPMPEFTSIASVVHDLHGICVETDRLRVIVDENGELAQVYDKEADREVLSKRGKGNELKLQEDIPVEWGSAWETTQKRDDKPPLPAEQVTCNLLESNVLFTEIEVEKRISGSVIQQRIRLYHHKPLIEFATTVHWNERHKILRVAFPVTVQALNAKYDVAFGNVERPTHTTHGVDEARFEVCGHKWGDISEGNYGVSLLNDCKYGYTIRDQVMELSLLRSADDPCTTCDQGVHHFTYWLYPHEGAVREAGVAQLGYALNVPLRVIRGRIGDADRYSFLSVDSQDVIIDTIKPAEDGDALIIRLFETYQTQQMTQMHFGFPVSRIQETDLMEHPIESPEPVKGSTGIFQLNIHPYEIKSYRVEM